MNKAVSAYTITLESILEAMTGRTTFDNIVVTPFNRHIWHRNKLELALFMLVSEVFNKPLALFDIAHCATDVVTSLQQLISNMAANKTIDTGDKDGGAGLKGERRHLDLRGV